MTTLLGFAAALAIILMAGTGTALLLAGRRLSPWECIALPWLLGTAVTSLVLWLGGLVVHGIVLQLLTTAVAVSLGVAGWKRHRGFAASSDRLARFDKWDTAGLILFGIEVAVLVGLALQHTLGWDGITVWELKARYAFLNGGDLPIAYFSDAARRFSHPEYPLLLPLTETWFYLWMGVPDQFWIKLIFPLWSIALFAVLFLSGLELSRNKFVAWVVALLFICVPGMHNAPGGVQGGYADIPLAALYVATAFYLLCFAREGGGDAFRLFVACATALPWMKREGSILWLIAVLAGGVLIARKRGISAALVSIVPGAALIAGWGIFLRLVHAVPSRDFFPVMSARLTNIDRLPMIANELWLELTHVPAWDIFWVVAALSLAAALLRERTRRVAMVGWLALAPIASYCATYLFSAWPDPVAHIETSLPRLLIAPAAVAWLALALALKPDLISPARPAPRPDAQSAPETDCS